MAKKAITLGSTKTKPVAKEVVAKEVTTSEVATSDDDAAAAVAAPGLEDFKTPDVSKPAVDSHVSDDSSERFAEGNIDWNKALDDADNEPDLIEEEEVVASKDSVVTSSVDEPVLAEVVETVVDPTESVAAAEEVVVNIDPDFQPASESEEEPATILSQEEKDKDYNDKRELALEQVSKRYEFSEGDRDQSLTNPEEFFPRMAAQVYLDVYESVLGAVTQMLPERVNGINAEYKANQVQINQFFKKWPDLNNPEGIKEVTRVGKVYRQLNTEASTEEFISNVGIQASLALGKEIPGVLKEAAVPDTDLPAFAPAGNSSIGDIAPVVDDPRKSNNQFERLNAEWDD